MLGLWIAFSFTPFILPKDIISQLSAKYLYSVTCHQISERCFGFDEVSMLICSRCFGIYVGLFAGSMLFSFSKIEYKVNRLNFANQINSVILFAAPFCIDVILSKLVVFDSGNVLRFLTGFLLTIPFSFFIKSSLTILSKEIYYTIHYAK